jgi:hypothetical protein
MSTSIRAALASIQRTGTLPECRDCANRLGDVKCKAFQYLEDVAKSSDLRPRGRCRIYVDGAQSGGDDI